MIVGIDNRPGGGIVEAFTASTREWCSKQPTTHPTSNAPPIFVSGTRGVAWGGVGWGGVGRSKDLLGND